MALTKAQLQAVEFEGNDLIISAAAGSGKTSTLVTKITEKIKKGADVSKMLVVTFTNAAAAELRTRLTARLGQILSEDSGNRHLSEQIIKMGSADICTIDAFCMKLVRSNFDKLGVDGDLRIGEESEISILRYEAMEDTLDAFYEGESSDPDFLTVCDCFGKIKMEEALAQNLLSLYKNLISTWESIELLLKNDEMNGDFMDTPHGAFLKEYIISMLDHFAKEYEYVLTECKRDEAATAYLPTVTNDIMVMEKLKAYISSSSYDEIRKFLLNVEIGGLGQIRKATACDKDYVKTVHGSFKEEIENLKESWFASDGESVKSAYLQNGKICRAIYKVLKIFEEELLRKKKAYSVYDFNDVERFALNILYNKDGTFTDTALEYQEKYEQVYIDEYQDTNSVQDRIFYAISRKNRFMVGDIKQSIYKFRAAEPENFARYRNEFTPIEKYKKTDTGAGIFMSNNFRSDKGVIDFSNLVSDHMFLNTTAIPYSKEDALIFSKEVPEGYLHEKAEVYLIRDKKSKRKKKNGEEENDPLDPQLNPEAEFVAARIRDMLDNGYLPTGEKIKAEYIAILLRTKGRRSDFISALERQGVNYEYENEERFFERSEVLFVLCLLNAIDTPSRDVYLAGALRSHVFGFSLEELVKIRQKTRNLPSLYASLKVYDEKDVIKEKIDAFFEKTEKYRSACRKLPSHEVISMLYTDLGILSSCARSERKSLLRLYDVARKYEGGAYKGISAFLRYVEKVGNDGIKVDVSKDSKKSVKIVTIHGSKGLEYPICFYCDSASSFNLKDLTEPILFERRLGIAGYVSAENGLVKFDTLMRKCNALAKKYSLRHEEMRKLYVALTRARNKIIVTAKVSDPVAYMEKKKKEAHCVSEYSLLKRSNTFEWIAGACAGREEDFFDLRIIDENTDARAETEILQSSAMFTEEDVHRVEDILRKRLEFKYEFDHLNKIPSKLSVSKLTPTILDGTENEEIEQSISLDTMPGFLNGGEKKITGADVGTATHLFMQFCDFNALKITGAENELQRLYKEGYISKNVADLVNIRYVEGFIGSELFNELLNAKSVKREFRFNVMLPASDFSEDEELKNEQVLVQGVTDCIYEDENGNVVLVDYKTDTVNDDNYRKVLISRHKNQLTYYKKACEMMLEREISKVILYSVPLSKNVEITEF